MKKTFKMLLVLFLIGALCVGCSSETEHTDENETEPAMIQTFAESDVTVIPEIEIYDFMTAKDIGEVQQILATVIHCRMEST